MNAPLKQHHVLSSDLANLTPLRQEVIQKLSEYDYPDNTVFAIRLAVDEALCNAIKHGNHQDKSKSIIVDYAIDHERFVMSVEDQGQGFRIKDVPDPTAKENLVKPSGRGVMLIDLYMTQVKYNQKGNQITITKDKNCPKPTR